MVDMIDRFVIRLLENLERETQALELYVSNSAVSKFECLSTAKVWLHKELRPSCVVKHTGLVIRFM